MKKIKKHTQKEKEKKKGNIITNRKEIHVENIGNKKQK